MRNISAKECTAVDAARRLRDLLVGLCRVRSLRDPYASTCEELQFTPPQLHTLAGLGHEGALTMGDLARWAGVTEKTMTGIVDRLERIGFVARVRSSEDRRVIRVQLTPKGKKEFERMDELFTEKLARVMNALDNRDRLDLLRIVQKLLDHQTLTGPSVSAKAALPTRTSP